MLTQPTHTQKPIDAGMRLGWVWSIVDIADDIKADSTKTGTRIEYIAGHAPSIFFNCPQTESTKRHNPWRALKR
jgi:hypothetical protein